MKVYGKLEVAQLEWFTNAGKPAASSYPYRVIFVTDVGSGQVQVSDGSSWIAAGSGSGGGSSFDTLVQKAIAEQYGMMSADLDYSALITGRQIGVSDVYNATLLSSATSTTSTIELVWNAIAVNSSDKNIDSTTNWTATNAGGGLTTSGTFKVGTASLSFTKAGTNTEAGIRYHAGSQTTNVASNTRVYYYINLPTVTGVSNVGLRMYADTTSNYRTWTTTTKADGSALASGWNLVYFDISTGGTASGSGWTYTQLSRYQEVFVTTAVAGTTLTATLVDSLYFGSSQATQLGVIGSEFTLFDTTNKENIVIASSNTQPDGTLTLVSALTNTYAGGLSVTARGRVVRNVLTIDGTNQALFNSDATFGGAITTAQEVRLATIHRQSVSKSYQVFVDILPAQRYAISGSITGTTFKVTDNVDDHLNLLSGDTVEIFRPTYTDNKAKYYLLMSTALTANSSYSSSETTLTVASTTGLAVGDVVCKKPFSAVSFAAASTPTSNESFSTLTVDTAPDGVQLIGDFRYPQDSSIYAHYTLADTTSSEAVRNRKGALSALSLTGSVGSTNFFNNRLAATSFTNSNYYSINSASVVQPISGDSADCTSVVVSFWFYDSTGFTASDRYIVGARDSGGGNGWKIGFDGTANYFKIRHDELNVFSGASYPYTTGQWNHVIYIVHDSTASKLYLNGVQIGSNTQAISTTTYNYFTVGKSYPGSSDAATGMYMADLIVWRNATDLSASEISYLYNRGFPYNSTKPELLRYKYTANAQSGQKVSMKVAMTRSTTAVRPGISKMGFIGS